MDRGGGGGAGGGSAAAAAAAGGSTAPANTSALEACALRYEDFPVPAGELFCNWTWDRVLCWPPTRAGDAARQRCPAYNGVDPTKFAHKRCGADGRWEGRPSSGGGSAGGSGDGRPAEGGGGGAGPTATAAPQGWTNYTPCFRPEVLVLMKKLFSGPVEAAATKLAIAERTRTLEIVGFSVSLAALLLSLAIFCHFRSLRNNRTRIHKHLFVAMVIQVVIRLTLYIDQAVLRGGTGGVGVGELRAGLQGINNTAGLCEAGYVLLEYARTAMFMWMFVEGLYLHNMITVSVFQEHAYYAAYPLLGWGAPVLMTTAWAVATGLRYGSSRCWYGYNLTRYFWILEGPRLGVVVLNFLFLLNIIRVLVLKLRQTRTSELEQVRKAVRAALVLLPLLGITNLVNMAEAPLERAVWQFALWSYGTHCLTSFQGLLIACLYCFLNGEVRAALAKSLAQRHSFRGRRRPPPRRASAALSGVYVTADTHPPPPPPPPPSPPPSPSSPPEVITIPCVAPAAPQIPPTPLAARRPSEGPAVEGAEGTGVAAARRTAVRARRRNTCLRACWRLSPRRASTAALTPPTLPATPAVVTVATGLHGLTQPETRV